MAADVNIKKNITIIIATHKAYRMPEDEMYLPLHVGAEGKTLELGYTKDNTGDHISSLNPGFCELTGLYWAWKNIDADYIGLVHYRRHFSYTKTADPFDGILKYSQIAPKLGKIKIFTPNKRRYFIESLYSHYKHTRFVEPLDESRKIIGLLYPEYAANFDRVVKKRYGYMFNMMIMQKELVSGYCQWLFDILFELRNRMEQDEAVRELSEFQSRFYGAVSEILFNVWLDRQLETAVVTRDEVAEIPVVHLGHINWWKKGTAFLMAKFTGKQYEESF